MSFSFGGATSVAPSASSGFSFGASSGAAAPAANSGFGFGATPATASSGFSFGGATSATTSTAPATSSGFSFGSGASAAAPAASSGFSFGGGASTSATPAPAATNSFGFGAMSSAPSAFSTGTGGGFGATTPSSFSFGGNTNPAMTTAANPSAFGATTGSSSFGAATGTSSFGLFGGNTAAPAAAPAPSGTAITLETVFEALPADVQKNMGEFHAFLKEQDQSDTFLKSVSPRQLETLQQNLAQLEQDVLTHRNVQDKQQTAVHAVRKDVRQLIHQVDTASLSLRSMDGSSATGNAYYSHIMRRVEMPSPYYWDLLEHFEAQMETLKRQIEDVEAQFLLQSSGNSSASSQFHPARLQQILMAQNAALMQVAARVAEVHESAEEMRQLFLAKMRRDLERHGEKNPAAFKNPFDKRKKSAAGDQDKRQAIDSIRFRTNVAPTIVSAAPQQQQPAQATPSAFGFNASPTFGSTATGTTGFGSFGATSTATPAATASTGGFGFGATSSAAAAASTNSTTATASTTTSGFSFGATTSTTAPKQVGFNLGASTAASPTATTAASPTFSFGAPAAAPTGGFGSVTSSFAPGGTSTNSNKRTGRMQKKRS